MKNEIENLFDERLLTLFNAHCILQQKNQLPRLLRTPYSGKTEKFHKTENFSQLAPER